ncbi:MAG: pseudouridine synthase [Treponema sp.]|nr:pseudouridine synthase [Treponema sp.]
MDNTPYILEETENYAVIYKPPKMHCTSRNNTANESGDTLYDWYSAQTKYFFDVMHRLDYETHGLVLFAKNEKSFLFFKDLQDRGEFIKEYSAVVYSNIHHTEAQRHRDYYIGFPPCTPWLNYLPFSIESYFRPYGPGRKLVRPVVDIPKKHKEIAKDKGGFYKTEIINAENNIFTVQIKRGFRHQIRCHLCWIGFPILNDPLYTNKMYPNVTEVNPANRLALRSHALYFTDPVSCEKKEYRIEPIKNTDI